MKYLIPFFLQITIGLFLLWMWKVDTHNIGFFRFMIGWVIGITVIENTGNIVRMILK